MNDGIALMCHCYVTFGGELYSYVGLNIVFSNLLEGFCFFVFVLSILI